MKQVKIRTKLKVNDINLEEAKPLLGKNVEIIINEVEASKDKRVWNHAGSLNLKGKHDNINIRDIAHD